MRKWLPIMVLGLANFVMVVDGTVMNVSIMVVVGRGLAANGTVEVRNRTTGDEKVELPLAEVVAAVSDMVREGRRGLLPGA